MDEIHVATLNLRNLADRWDERLPLILADMSALQPDLLGLQECVYPLQQDRLIGAAGEGRYAAIRGWAGRLEYGNSMLVREPLVAVDVERFDLRAERAVHRVRIDLPNGASVVVAVTHFHHLPIDSAIRDAQAEALIGWLDASAAPEESAYVESATSSAAADALIVMGDFNANPSEPAYARMRAAGFRSSFAEANGTEPDITWPSGLQGPMIDAEGTAQCIDYIWIRGRVSVESCRLVFDRPAVGDPTLYPSDHFGLAARLKIG
jgi:endonuclease/exonuclease/phosphatase family metal-dependent hydrolase